MTDNPPPTAPAAPPGWYDNPATGQRTYWDGSAWGDVAQPVAPSAKPHALSVAALIVGGAGFLLGLIPVLGMIVGLAGAVLGVVALIRNHKPRWMSAVGTALGAIAFLTGIIVFTVAVVGTGINSGLAGAPTPAGTTAETPVPTPSAEPVEVPDVVGMETSEGLSALIDAGFLTRTTGDDGTITEQDPSSGSAAVPGSTVRVTSVLDFDSFDKLSEREYGQFAKSPDKFAGRHLLIYGVVWQFDSATGPCNLLANTSWKKRKYSYSYDVNTWVSASPCSVLDPVVQDDHVAMWVEVKGAYSYDTAIGGTSTAVEVKVLKVKILKKQEY